MTDAAKFVQQHALCFRDARSGRHVLDLCHDAFGGGFCYSQLGLGRLGIEIPGVLKAIECVKDSE